MTIIKNDSPPPAYSAIPSIDSTDRSAERPSASSSQAPPSTLPFPVYGTSFPSELPDHPQHQAYGPTPLPQQLQQGALLPYHDPRSPHSRRSTRAHFLPTPPAAFGVLRSSSVALASFFSQSPHCFCSTILSSHRLALLAVLSSLYASPSRSVVVAVYDVHADTFTFAVNLCAIHLVISAQGASPSLVVDVVAQQEDIARIYPSFVTSTSSVSTLVTVASTIAQQRSVPVPVHQHGGADEDFINRSLLDQIDTDADTDPVFSSDSEATGGGKAIGSGKGRNFGSSSSQSSVESSGVSFPYQMQVHSQPPPRSDSPSGQRASLAYAARGGEDFIHTPQQTLYHKSGSEPSTEFSPFPDSDTQSTGPFENSAFRSNSLFGPFLPRARPSMPGPVSAGFSPESNTLNFNQYNTLSAADVFGTHQSLSQLPHQQQQQTAGSRGYDFINDVSVMKPNGKPVFANMDPFNASAAGAAMLQSHQMSKPTQSQAQQQHHLQNYVGQSFPNGMLQAQQQSQPNYGAHIPPNHNVSMAAPSVSHANGLSNVATQQEEISTIFVVGFPDDMQEREFQNMFTFSSGFEAATLKIPNKDSTAYGSNAPSANAGNSGRGSYQTSFPYSGANDPYGFMGGPDGRDGWAPVDPNDPTGSTSNNQQGTNPQPRKQIIGFAKFRTRSEALSARDLLQGRRIDIEKGAVLKAEMAKKNLHTKRGVGPVGPPLSVNVGGPGMGGGLPNAVTGPHGGGLGSIPENMNAMTGMLSPGAGPGPELLTARERELGTLGAMGLGGLTRRDRFESQDEDRDSRRRRDFGSVNALTNSLTGLNIQATRGPRERLEEDEREREKRRREREAERIRLRAGNQAAYDAFHSVANAQRQPILSNVTSPSESLSALPFSASLFSPQESVSSQSLDGWPIGPVSNAERVANLGIGGTAVMSSVRSASLGIATNLAGVQSSSSQEASPTEPTPGPASVSSRSGASDHGASQETELFSPTPAMSLSSHPSMSSLSSRSRPYSPTADVPVTSSGILASLPEQQQSAVNQGQGLPLVPTSGSSSASGSRSSSGSVDEDVSRTISNIDVNHQQGAMSPQLPSPNSGSSSGAASRGNPSDQNPPINTLYVGNLPTSPIPGNQPNLLEDSLRSLFARCPGYRKLCFRQKSNGPMCFVEFEDVNYATRALSDLYGHTLNGLVKGGIRLSYSKNPLGVRTPTNVANGNGLQQSLQSLSSGSSSFSSLQEAFSRQSAAGILSIDMNVIRGMRRDASEVTSPSQYFASSPPPPRFFSPPPSSGFGFASQTSAPGLARSNNSSFASTFSPFGPSTPPEMAPQPAASEPAETVKSPNESTNAPNLDSARSA
ncbi:hypothetical protein ACEPAF_6341 [Sanghuangporus sanghuang]